MNRMTRFAMRYLRVSPLPHATALACLLTAMGLAGWAWALRHHCLLEATLAGCWAAGWAVVALAALADGYSRYLEYLRLKKLLARYGFRSRILGAVSRSRCQRDAAVRAASDAGFSGEAREFFRALGYRWYHLLPDEVAANPLAFLRPRFLMTTFLPRSLRGR